MLVPPPILMAITLVVMWFVNWLVPMAAITLPFRTPIALGLVAVGVFITFLAISRFGQAKTTITPIKPEKATTLVTDGIYNYTRNPMYLALLFVILGWGVWLGNVLNILALIVFYILMTNFQIKAEEVALFEKFGEAYKEYTKRVRRWV